MRTSKEVVEAWAKAFNERDADSLGALYTEDATNFQVADEPIHGRPAIIDSFRHLFRAFPDIGFEIVNLFEDGDWAILEWKGRGTHQGEFVGHPPSGNSYVLLGCGFFQVRAGRIVLQRGYWDRLTWFRQLGIEA